MHGVEGYHAHIYFDEQTLDQARALCEEAAQRFGVKMGRMHEKRVGPHPNWSCQLAFDHAQLADVVLWLALNRKGLVVLLYPLTGDELADHTEHAIWMGAVRDLDVSMFKRSEG